MPRTADQAQIGSVPDYTNPVYPHYFADPFVFRHQGLYYALGTGAVSPKDSWGEFQILESADLVHWLPRGPALRKPEGFENGNFWAPEVTRFGNRFYLYYSVGVGDKHHHIRVAIAELPEGPYLDQGRLTGPEIPFAIDAHVYEHTDGDAYLFYAADNLDTDRPGTCLMVDRLVTPLELEGNPQLVASATADWQRFESNRLMYGGTYDWHTLEGPSVVRHEEKLYVLYSGGNWQNESYGVDFVVADHPLGPYRNETGDEPRTMKTVPGEVLGPGHNSVILGPDGSTLYIVYHAWNPARTARLMRIDPLQWTEDGPRVDGPTYTPQSRR